MCRSVLALSDTRWHTRSMRYVFGRRARTLCSRGNGVRSLWAFFLWEKSSALGCPLFSIELGWSSAPRGSGPAAAEAVKRLSLRRSQMKLANEFEREEFFISRSTAADESELREEDVLSVTSSDPAGSALLAHGVLLSLLSLSAPRCRAAGGYEAGASAR